MSLVNVILEKDRAWVASDTRFKDVVSGSFFEGSKLFPLVHCNVIFASRGDRRFAGLVHGFYNGAFGNNYQDFDFDSIESSLSEVIENVKAHYELARGPHHDEEISRKYGGINFVTVGWSKSRGRMHAIHCSRENGMGDFTMGQLPNGVYGPAPKEDMSAMHFSNHQEALLAIARVQVREVLAEQPGYPIGGHLVVAELSANTMSFNTVAGL